MTRTAPLTVLGDFSMDEKTVNIHPNDGFDLGLMTTEHVVRIYVGATTDLAELSEESFVYGKIHLRNEVRNGHVELGLKSAQRLDGAKKVVVSYESGERYGSLLINPA